MKPLAIVTPWFGKDLKGGAEQQAWQVAARLADRGHAVEVLTTCCRSFQDDWAVNHLKPGLTKEQGIKIRRFHVDRRNRDAFDRSNSLMLGLTPSKLKPGVSPVGIEDAKIFCSENINSTQLIKYLKKNHEQYQAFFFIPYLYGPILRGLSVVANHAFLQPCLHDEVYAYLPQVADIFHNAKGLLFISEGEYQLARKLYGPGITTKSVVVGAGIESGRYYDDTLNQIGNLLVKRDKFILCLGRRDSTKNTDLLVRAYIAFKKKCPESVLKLVLAGPGDISFNDSIQGLIDLELVAENEKEALLANCLALFQPSRNESYSRVIMEAWFYGRPVAVHQKCLATAIATENAKGGWLANTEPEWTELFVKIDQLPREQLNQYGVSGQVYVKESAVWDKVIERYEDILGLSKEAIVTPKIELQKLKEIHQILPNLSYGDAISNHTLAIRDHLLSGGYKSDIFVRYLDEKVAHEAKVFNPKYISSQAGLIYHHSIGSEITDYVVSHQGPKCLIYHNITPPAFFQPYRPEFAKILEEGLADLGKLAQYFPLCVGDSTFNANELLASGFSNPGVLPISVDSKKWDMIADNELMQKLQDGKSNLLFVGRLAPNKRQEHLLEAFAHYLIMDKKARLILVGYGDTNDPYYLHLMNTIKRLRLTKYVIIAGQSNDAQLLAFYRTAHLFWSMSEHEGFCVPLIESMWFDIPILAYKSSAIPETLDKAGIMFTSKENPIQVAALAKIIVKDEILRSKVISAQRQRRNDFLPDLVYGKLNELVLKMQEMWL
jgi:glycosyltransferase involved in cell wall biosynthesis